MLYLDKLEESGFYLYNKALVELDSLTAYPLTARKVPFILGDTNGLFRSFLC